MRPERLQLMAFTSRSATTAFPGMVERTVYVGASLQVMVRLPTGITMQASVANTGVGDSYRQGIPVLVHVPPDALRVLAGAAVASDRDSPEPEPVSASRTGADDSE